VFQQEFRTLETGRQVLLCRFLYDAGPSKTDQCRRFRDDHIAQRRKTGHDAGRGRMGQNGNIGQPGRRVARQRGAGLGHLHQAQHAFIHPGPGGGADDHDGHPICRRTFDQLGYLLPDHRSHAGPEKRKIHDPQPDAVRSDAGAPHRDGIAETRLLDILRQFLGVGVGPNEAQRVHAAQPGVPFFK